MPDWIASIWFYATVAGVFALVGVWLLYRGLLRDRSRGKARCPRCWYDLSGAASAPATGDPQSAIALPVTCPECGRVCHKAKQLHRTRRHWFTAALALMVLGLTAYSYEVRHRIIHYQETFRTAVVPSTYYLLALESLDMAGLDRVQERFENHIVPVPFALGAEGASGFWRWQERLYQQRLSAIVARSDSNLWQHALYLLWDMAHHGDDAALALFAEHLDHEDAAIRLEAMNDAQLLGERILPWRDAILARLHDADKRVADSAVWALHMMGPMQCQGLTDEKLGEVATTLVNRCKDFSTGVESVRDMYLAAMVRRGGPAMARRLREMAAEPPLHRWGDGIPVNLELLTALHRLEGKPDPLSIEIDPTEPRVKVHHLFKITATIRLSDGVTTPIGFQFHGDNRGERPMRWRFEVRDEAGRLMPMKLESHNFGGIASYGTLTPDKSYTIDLHPYTFIEQLPPGKYTMIVQYHNGIQISSQADISHYIVTQSKPVTLMVQE